MFLIITEASIFYIQILNINFRLFFLGIAQAKQVLEGCVQPWPRYPPGKQAEHAAGFTLESAKLFAEDRMKVTVCVCVCVQ